MAAQFDFVYAAMLVEAPLESVDKLLAQGGDSVAFGTFALSVSAFDEAAISKVIALVPEAHVERHTWGTLFVVGRLEIPEDSAAPGLSSPEVQERSLRISALLAGSF